MKSSKDLPAGTAVEYEPNAGSAAVTPRRERGLNRTQQMEIEKIVTGALYHAINASQQTPGVATRLPSALDAAEQRLLNARASLKHHDFDVVQQSARRQNIMLEIDAAVKCFDAEAARAKMVGRGGDY